MRELFSAFLAGARAGIHRLIAINLLFFLLALPVLAWFYLILNTYINAALEQDMVDILPGFGFFVHFLLQLPPFVFYLLAALSALLLGPLALGLHAVAGGLFLERDILLSKFFKHAWQNAGRGVLLGIFGVVFTHLSLWNILGGISADAAPIALMLTISRWASLLLLLLFFLALPFICQITVFIKLPFWAVVKNAVILSRVYIGRSLFALIGILAYWWFTSAVMPLFSLISLPFLSLSLTVLIQALLCFPPVDKHILKPAGEGKGRSSVKQYENNY